MTFRDILFRLFALILEMLGLEQPKITNSLHINVKTNTGRILSVDLNPKWDVSQLKETVALKLETSPREIKIIFAGKELHDAIIIEECDLGPQSILHAVKIMHQDVPPPEVTGTSSSNAPNNDVGKMHSPAEASRPLCETLIDLQLTNEERNAIGTEELHRKKAHFYVYCSTPCKALKAGKLRVRCSTCHQGAVTVIRDPCCWNDVLLPGQIPAFCETVGCHGNMAEFYFKCADHPTQGEDDIAVALYLIKSNLKNVSCLVCTEVSDPVLVFVCEASHVVCLECFKQYALIRLKERQFVLDPELGYTLPCPAGCEDSLIREIHHFKLLAEDQYSRYQRFGAEECVLRAGGVLCPRPGCGMGILADPECRRIHCETGCGFVFCRICLQGFHIGECQEQVHIGASAHAMNFTVDPERAAQARWDAASKMTIQMVTKPCPKCRTPTERDGGCMHMICPRPQCGFHWCWICLTEWSRECMGNHWFG